MRCIAVMVVSHFAGRLRRMGVAKKAQHHGLGARSIPPMRWSRHVRHMCRISSSQKGRDQGLQGQGVLPKWCSHPMGGL